MRGDGAAVTGVHHVEIYVSNSYQAAYFFRTVLGFDVVGDVSPRWSADDRASIAIRRGDVRVILTAPRTATSEVGEHIRLHGEGIKDIAFAVRDVDSLFDRAAACGASPLLPPDAVDGAGRTARIGVYGDLVHSLIEGPEPTGTWWPVVAERTVDAPDTALDDIDHIAIALGAGQLDDWVAFYQAGLDFVESHHEDVRTEYSAMRSKVVQTADGSVRLPMMEPALGPRVSQIETYVQSHTGPGAQHLALRSHDIVRSVATLSSGLEFLPTPDAYYDALPRRLGIEPEQTESLRRHGILVDREPDGLLLQVFTRPIGMRPTMFLEVIERRGAAGFGAGNIRALFEAVERTQGT